MDDGERLVDVRPDPSDLAAASAVEVGSGAAAPAAAAAGVGSGSAPSASMAAIASSRTRTVENPPLLIVSDMVRFRIRTNWSSSSTIWPMRRRATD